MQIARGPFLTLVKKHPAIALKIMVQLAGALRKATEQIRTLSMFDVYGRVLRCLARHGAGKGPECQGANDDPTHGRRSRSWR